MVCASGIFQSAFPSYLLHHLRQPFCFFAFLFLASTPSRPADPQLTLTEDLASAALSAWKVPPPDHHVAGFVTCFSSKRTFSEMPFLTPLLKQPPVWLCLRLSVLISSQQSLPSSMTLCIYTGLCLTPQHPALKCTSHDNRKLVCLPHHSDLPCSGRV